MSSLRFLFAARARRSLAVGAAALVAACALDACSGDADRKLSMGGPDSEAPSSNADGGKGTGGRRNPPDEGETEGGLADASVVDAGRSGGGGAPGTATGGAAGSSGAGGASNGGVGGQPPSGGGSTAMGGSAGNGGGGASGSTSTGGGGAGGGSTSKCGNNVKDPSEECDDGNSIESDNCALCTDRTQCLACLADGCDAQIVGGCSGFTDAGEKASCEAVYACAAKTECAITRGSLNCYCGSTEVGACRAGNPTGPCKAEIEASFNKYHGELQVTDPQTIVNNLGVVDFPFGAALAQWQCAFVKCGPVPANSDFPEWVCSPAKHPKPDGSGGGSAAGGAGSGGASSGGASSGGASSGGASSGGASSGGASSGGAGSGGTNTGGTNTGGANTGGANTGGAVQYCTLPKPTQVADPDVCNDCEQNFCDQSVMPGCSRFPANSAERVQCTQVLTCIRSSNCINKGNVNCYCGSASIVECRASEKAANGDCKNTITAAFPDGSDAATIINNIGAPGIPGGAALALGQCDFSRCGEVAQSECVPYCQ